jgi:hypothetical protein
LGVEQDWPLWLENGCGAYQNINQYPHRENNHTTCLRQKANLKAFSANKFKKMVSLTK